MYSLSQFPRPVVTRLFTVGTVAAVLAGCSMPMGSLMGGGDDKPEITSSTTPKTGRSTASAPTAPAATSSGVQTAQAGQIPLSQTDWNYARGALGLALTSTQSGPPVPWANPETGTRGNFAPASEAVTADGRMCRDFVATRTENGREVQLQGRACRTAEGQWDIAETSRTTL